MNKIHIQIVIWSITLFGIGIAPVYAQSFWKDITISVDLAAAHHDDRRPNRLPNLSENRGDRWGTWQYGISIHKNIFDWKNIRFEAGLGYNVEHFTYFRRINHCFLYGDACPYVAVYSDNYKVHLIEIPVTITYTVVGNLKAELSVIPLFNIHKKLKYSIEGGDKTTFNFYSIEINPGIRYQINRIGLSLNYRLYQIKKIDQVLFGPTSERIEHYNPLKFWFSVGYRLGNAACLW